MDCGRVQVRLLLSLSRQVLAYAGRTDGSCDIDPFATVPDGCLGGAGAGGRKTSAGQPEVDNMGACLGNSVAKTLQVRRISRREMIQQWIDVVNRESLHHHGGKLFDVDARNAGARNAGLRVAIGRSCHVGTEGPRGDGQPITGTGGKLQLRMTTQAL